jgi:predicted RNA polymerase sigma factor
LIRDTFGGGPSGEPHRGEVYASGRATCREGRVSERALADYHLFYAARADMIERTGGDPRPDLEKAISLAMNEGEKRLLERRLHDRLARMQPP